MNHILFTLHVIPLCFLSWWCVDLVFFSPCFPSPTPLYSSHHVVCPHVDSIFPWGQVTDISVSLPETDPVSVWGWRTRTLPFQVFLSQRNVCKSDLWIVHEGPSLTNRGLGPGLYRHSRHWVMYNFFTESDIFTFVYLPFGSCVHSTFGWLFNITV